MSASEDVRRTKTATFCADTQQGPDSSYESCLQASKQLCTDMVETLVHRKEALHRPDSQPVMLMDQAFTQQVESSRQ